MASAANYQAWVEVLPEFKGFNKEVKSSTERSLGNAGAAGGKVFGAGLTGAMGALGGAVAVAGVAAVAGVGVALGKTISKGLDRSLSIQDSTAKLTGLGHSAEGVRTIMDSALASVKGTAFGLGDAAEVAAGAVAAGIEPGEKLTRVLKLAADAATIAGSDLNSMGSIFNKVAASGKLQGDVIAQLQDAGVPVLQFVAKQMGVTAGEAIKLASEGKVSFEIFSAAMEEGLGGAALSSGKTARGAFANLEAAVGRFGAKFTDPVVAAAPAFFGAITGAMDLAAGSAGPFAEAIGVRVGGALERAGDKITTFTDSLGDIKSLLSEGDFVGAFQSVFDLPDSSPIVGILSTIGEAATQFKSAFNGFGEGVDLPKLLGDLAGSFSPLGAVLEGLLPVVPVIAKGVGELAASLGEGLLDAAQELLPPISALSGALSDGIASIATDPALQASLGELVSAFGELGATTLPTLVPVVAALVTAWTPLVPVFTDLISSALPTLVDLLTFLVTPTRDSAVAGTDLGNAMSGVAGAYEFLLTLLPGGFVAFQGLKDAFTGAKSASDITADALAGKYGTALQFAAQKTVAFYSGVREAFSNVRTVVDSRLAQVQATGQRVWSSLPGPVRSALSSIGSVVSSGISGAVSTIGSLPGRASAALGNLSGALFGAGRSLVDGFVNGMTGGIQRAASAAAQLARSAVNAAKSALDINSPSRVFRDQVGLMVGLGMAEGIDRSSGQVAKAVSGLTAVPELPTRSFAFDASVSGASSRAQGSPIKQENNFNMIDEDPQLVARKFGRELNRALAGAAL